MMQRVHVAARPHPRHLGWVSRAVASGFLASIAALIVLVAAYGIAAAVGSKDPHAGPFALAFYNLANNPVTNLVSSSVHVVQAVGLHLVAGIIWAAIYAGIFEPRLEGPGWRKGLIFAVLPLLFSICIFLPAVGAGFFGLGLNAGVLPGVGAIILHAVYGIALGETYALADGEGLLGGVDSIQARAFTNVERDMAMGIAAGAVIGAIVGIILWAVGVAPGGSDALVLSATGGATEGAIAGVVVGIFAGWITSGG